jgi:uncharacterized protein YehS (DUF1456 family)
MECGDQVLRNFLNGLVIHLRGTKENQKNPNDVLANTKHKYLQKMVQKSDLNLKLNLEMLKNHEVMKLHQNRISC